MMLKLLIVSHTEWHFNFIRCVEQNISKGGLQSGKVSAVYQEKSSNVAALKVWESCAEGQKLEEADIYKCYTSGRGREVKPQFRNRKPMLAYATTISRSIYEEMCRSLTNHACFNGFAALSPILCFNLL